MTWEMIKENNGWKTTSVSDLNIGDVILFDGETDETQGSRITDIIDNNRGNIIIEYIPEYTPVRNVSLFHYGTKNFRLKTK